MYSLRKAMEFQGSPTISKEKIENDNRAENLVMDFAGTNCDERKRSSIVWKENCQHIMKRGTELPLLHRFVNFVFFFMNVVKKNFIQ